MRMLTEGVVSLHYPGSGIAIATLISQILQSLAWMLGRRMAL
jgi:hypothetical protein